MINEDRRKLGQTPVASPRDRFCTRSALLPMRSGLPAAAKGRKLHRQRPASGECRFPSSLQANGSGRGLDWPAALVIISSLVHAWRDRDLAADLVQQRLDLPKQLQHSAVVFDHRLTDVIGTTLDVS
jgi:hypothetical protein